jgi:hypothetical protein
MKITRQWAMPNKNTYDIPPISNLIKRYISGDWVDPFVGYSKFGHLCSVTNDFNPEIPAKYHLEALEFLQKLDSNSYDGVFLDPPYSLRQVKEVYNEIGRDVLQWETQNGYFKKHKIEIARILKVGGVALCFGWNSGGIGMNNLMQMEEVLLVPHGGAHNDTIVTVERKIAQQADLFAGQS